MNGNRFTIVIIFVGIVASVAYMSYAASSLPKPLSTHHVSVDANVYGDGENKDIRYNLPLQNGEVFVGEYAKNDAVSASDGTAGFRTENGENGNRRSHLTIQGTTYTTVYTDIDGDGILDAMENLTTKKLYISIQGKWSEVHHQKVGFSIGNSRRTKEGNQGFLFKSTKWVAE